jgi:hypothetical protein
MPGTDTNEFDIWAGREDGTMDISTLR